MGQRICAMYGYLSKHKAAAQQVDDICLLLLFHCVHVQKAKPLYLNLQRQKKWINERA
jgi:hypothetical protein